MGQSSWIAILMLAACGGGDDGPQLATVATLPSLDLRLAFDADGTPIVGSEVPPSPLRRFDGAAWVPHTPMTFETFTFGSDADGAPLVIQRNTSTMVTEVWRIGPGGTAGRLGNAISELTSVALQGGSGTRFLFASGATYLLPSGAATWQRILIALKNPVRGADGQIYANLAGQDGIVRLRDDGGVSPTACTASQFGVDPRSRVFLSTGTGVEICDPATGALQPIVFPPGITSIGGLSVTRSRVVVAASSPSPEELGLFTMSLEETTASLVGPGPDFPFMPPGSIGFQLHASPTGDVYATNADWLGKIVDK